MSNERCGVPTAREARRRKRRAALHWPWFHHYQLPGYGPAHRWWQQTIHRHGYCVMTRQVIAEPDDGAIRWRCGWCGNRSVQTSLAEKKAQLQRAAADLDRQAAAASSRPGEPGPT